MAEMHTVRQKPTNNIYTAMVFIAFIALVIGVAVVWMQNLELTEGIRPQGESFPNPFYIAEPPAQ